MGSTQERSPHGKPHSASLRKHHTLVNFTASTRDGAGQGQEEGREGGRRRASALRSRSAVELRAALCRAFHDHTPNPIDASRVASARSSRPWSYHHHPDPSTGAAGDRRRSSGLHSASAFFNQPRTSNVSVQSAPGGRRQPPSRRGTLEESSPADPQWRRNTLPVAPRPDLPGHHAGRAHHHHHHHPHHRATTRKSVAWGHTHTQAISHIHHDLPDGAGEPLHVPIIDTKRLVRRMRMSFRAVLIVIKWFYKSRAMRDERMYHEQMKEIDPVSIRPAGETREEAEAVASADDATFFFDDYKANCQMKMPLESKRILEKPPEERTEHEIYYAMIALRSIQQVADLPVRMQRVLAQNGFYESYEPKRVVVKEKHRARAFYFILYGTVLVAVQDAATECCKTMCRLPRGDSFGELAIIHGSPRQSSVISGTEIELLSISTEVYKRLFMCGGKRDLNDPDHYEFMSNLGFLQGWPIELLDDDPERIRFSYFKRGSVLVKDSNYSDWIYIVKSGSLHVLKKLANRKHTVDARTGVLSQPRQLGATAKRRAFQCDQFDSVIDRYNLTFPSPIGIRSDAGTVQPPTTEEQAQETGSAAETLEEVGRQAEGGSEESNSEISEGVFGVAIDTVCRAQTAIDGGHRQGSSSQGERSNRPVKSAGSRDNDRVANEGKEVKRTYIDDLNQAYEAKEHVETEADRNPVFVQVRTLTKGQTFGLANLVFEDQPSFVLVSNGAECITINRRWYMEHCPAAVFRKLKTTVSPYPSESRLQDDLMTRVNWDVYKAAILRQQTAHLKQRQRTNSMRL